MTFPDGVHSSKVQMSRIIREIAWAELARFWRELAR